MSDFESTDAKLTNTTLTDTTLAESRLAEARLSDTRPVIATPAETGPKKNLTALATVVVILLAIACGVFIYWQLTHGFSTPPARAPLVTAPPPPSTPATPALDLPPLEESDDMVRSLLQGLSDHPRFAAWLLPDHLVTRFVTAVDNVSRGGSPRSHLGFLNPGGEFRVREGDGELTIDPASFARYNRFTEVFLSLDTRTGVRLYRQLEPLFKQAYQELGYPEEDFDRTLAKAIDHLLATPIPQGPAEVERRITGFQYQDPQLENLSPAQKQYLRLGPEHARQLHAKLRLMQTALGLTEAQRQAQ